MAWGQAVTSRGKAYMVEVSKHSTPREGFGLKLGRGLVWLVRDEGVVR